jgi:preprotein translocase subunit SecD
MLDFPRWKIWTVTLSVVLGILLAVPSVLPPAATGWMPGWFRDTHVNLGLDLAGGSQLLLEAQTGDIATQRVEAMEEIIRREMRTNRIDIGDISTAGGQLSFMVRNPTQVDAAVERVRAQTQPAGAGLSGQRDWTVNVLDSSRIVVRPTPEGIAAAFDNAMTTAREVVFNRVDPDGTREVNVVRQGRNRILVEVPGIEDPEALKALLGRTARLEFSLVDQRATQEQLAAGRAPIGSRVLPMAEGAGRIAVQRRAMITGDRIADARQDFNQQGAPAVTIQFDNQGARAFARVTQQNVNKPFAIILDNVVISAPNINEPILGGSAQISGSFTVASANDLAVQLRSGRLPVELRVVEERTVGPTLGRDSIRSGIIAGAIGTALILVFMFITYGRFGFYANIALVLNVVLILGIMALMGSSLTLPGIAGFVLTVGAAVDANVIINERIREELRRGRRPLQALEVGYSEAQTAIFDANITNVIAGALLWYFGTGPVKGFAVVMLIGIVTSVFTAVTVTRMLVSLWLRRGRPQELRI